ncbi:1895_t:CDS:2, partial [Racocetra fulgida]
MNKDITYEVYDNFLDKAVTYVNTEINNEAIERYTAMCDRVKAPYFNEANAEFMKMYLYKFALTNSCLIIRIRLQSLQIKQLVQYIMEFMEKIFFQTIGTPTGNEEGGDAFTIRGLDEKYNYVVGVNVHYRERVVSGIQFVMSDGQKTQNFGNGEANQKIIEAICGPIGYNNDFKFESKATEHYNLCV